MAKRFIGIDTGLSTLRVVTLVRENGAFSVASVTECAYSEDSDAFASLKDFLQEEGRLGDRLATCLPAGSAFVRRMNFPFSDKKKINAALPFELDAQLPVDIDGYVVSMQSPVKQGEGTSVVASAVKREDVVDTIESFDRHDIPLHILDLAPHAYVAGLREFLSDGLLVCALEHGLTLVMVRSGEVVDYRHLPLSPELPVSNLASVICREAVALGRAHLSGDAALQMMGSLASQELVAELTNLWGRVELLSIEIGGQIIESAMLPAVALALRAADKGNEQVFNLRKGEFALKGELSGLHKTLWKASCLLGLTLLVFIASLTINYYDKHSQVAALEESINDVFKETFPNVKKVVDVPLQMKSAILQLRESAGMIGYGQQQPLQLLKDISKVVEEQDGDVDEFTMESKEVRVSGRVETFEAINSMAEALRQLPYVDQVEIVESKMELSGQNVSYRMRMVLSAKGASS